MEFYDWTLTHTYGSALGFFPPRKDLPVLQFYDQYVRYIRDTLGDVQRAWKNSEGTRNRAEVNSLVTSFNVAVAEFNWIKASRPYLKLFPAAAELLLQTSFDIPTEMLRCPFRSLLLRLPVDNNLDARDNDGRELRSILIHELPVGGVHSLHDGKPSSKRVISFWLEHGNVIQGAPLYSRFDAPLIEDDTVEGSLKSFLIDGEAEWSNSNGDAVLGHDAVVTALQIAVGAIMLMTSRDACVEHDVLNKHLERYQEADPDEKDELHEKAKKRGKFGWLIGREIPMPGTVAPRGDYVPGSGKPLEFSQNRRGHWHTILFGPGREQRKVKWIRPIIVRPDLPPNPNRRRGFKAPGDSHASPELLIEPSSDPAT